MSDRDATMHRQAEPRYVKFYGCGLVFCTTLDWQPSNVFGSNLATSLFWHVFGTFSKSTLGKFPSTGPSSENGVAHLSWTSLLWTQDAAPRWRTAAAPVCPLRSQHCPLLARRTQCRLWCIHLQGIYRIRCYNKISAMGHSGINDFSLSQSKT